MTSIQPIRGESRTGPARRGRDRPRPDLGAIFAFGLPAAALLLYALRGGSYDIVVRQELGLAVWWILLLGFATGLLPRARLDPLVALPAFGLVTFAAITALGLTYSESDERTVNELARVLHYGGAITLILCLIDRRTWRHATVGLVTGAALVSILALGSRLWPDLFPPDAVGRVFPSSRLHYPLGYWNGVAAFTAMTAVMAVGLSAHARSGLARALALAPVPAILGATYLTYARGGIVAVVVGSIATLVLVPHRALFLVHGVIAAAGSAAVIALIRAHSEIAHGRGNAGAELVALVCVLAAVLCAAVALATAALKADKRLRLPPRLARAVAVGTGLVVLALGVSVGPRLADSAIDKLKVRPQAAQSSDPAARLGRLSSSRYSVWSAALDIHAAEPLHGIGPGTFEFEWNRSPHYIGFLRDAHSFYLESLAEQGWLGLTAGLILLGGLLGVAVVIRVRDRGDPGTAGYGGVLLAGFVIFLAYAGFDWMWEETAVTVFGLVAVSIAIASRSEPVSSPPRVTVRIAAAFVALVIGLTQLPGLVSTAKIRSSQTAAQRGDLSSAEVDAEDAVASAPWAASPYVQRALLLERAGRLTDARADILRAIQREPTNYRHPLLLARIEALRGRVRPALAAFRTARELAPKKIIEAGGPKVTSPDDGP